MDEKVLRVKDELLKIHFITPKIVNFHYSKYGKFDKNYSLCVDYEKIKDSGVRVTYEEGENYYRLSTDYLEIIVSKELGKVSIYDKGKNLILSDYEDKGYVKEGKKIYTYKKIRHEEAFLGFGERLGPLNKRGHVLINWNTDESDHSVGNDPLYQSHPFFIAWHPTASYGLFFDNTFLSYFDMGKEDKDYYYFCAEDGDLDYYFIYGSSPKDVIEGYTYLTGRYYMPPLWSLGLHQSRWSYDSEIKLYNLAKEFRKRNIPCDALYLDIDYMRGYRVFTINKKRFPHFEKMVKDLKNLGFKLVVIIDPGVKWDRKYEIFKEGLSKDFFCRMENGKVFTGYVWPGKSVFPDFLRKEVRNFWGEKLREFINMGVSGFWNDMNEPSVFSRIEYWAMKILFHILKFKEPPKLPKPKNFEEKIKQIKRKTVHEKVIHKEDDKIFYHSEIHNLYGLLMNQATFEGFLKANPHERPFILTRSGFSGIQKYSAVWCGDNKSSWENLFSSIITLQNLSISGVPFIGEDVGGFWGDCERELFVRWMELGIFYPFFRIHTAKNTRNQEPWSFGDEAEKIAKDFISLRYRLIPYIYSLFYEAKEKGIPLIRSLILEFPNSKEVLSYEDEFMFGPFILVAPVYEKEKRERKVYLPEGFWYDFYTGKRYRGGTLVKVNAPLNKIPLFLREGAIIPMWNTQSYVGEKKQEMLNLEVYPGDGKFLYYEDDGISWDYEKGMYNLIEFSTFKKEEKQFLRIRFIHKGYKDGTKSLKVHYCKKEKKLELMEGEFEIN
ncbi:glycoside hydrolase family 31 protein [Dictyoglomus turgidum]|uniref:glycoside hydrolase family 31 protein n=1 Tax=Dictyoglomus turgidum TaxID=513050 RepID=UPI002355DB6C|nr:glycoside hydrolase family 31 protein [Dictyoglomus turgidum]